MTLLDDRSTDEAEKEPVTPPPARPHRPLGPRIVLYVVLVLGAVPTLLPLFWLVRSALMGTGQIFTAPPEWLPDPFEWENFSGALTAAPFGTYLVNTLMVTVLSVIGTVLSCSLAAFSLARLRWRGRNVVFGLLMSGLMLPYAVTLIPTFMMWRALGAVDTFVPLILPSFFGSPLYGGMFSIFLLRQFFLTIPYDLDEAAYIDGASPLRVFWTIIIPLSKPALLVVTLFTTLSVWNDYLNPLIYLNSQENYTLAVGLASFQGTYTAQWGYLMAAALMVIAPMVALFLFAQRYFTEGIALTGMKG